MSDPLFIRQIIAQVLSGQIRVPTFQRGFVWDADRVAFLMDSIYKGYPFGSILLWRTKERLKFERKLGPFELPNVQPDFPIDYILDGQQRITSIFGVFQTELEEESSEDWTRIYFDYRANPDAQESQFTALEPQDFDSNRYFLLRNLFDTTAYRRATKDFDDQRQTILKWFWRTCFSRRYNSQPIKSLQADIKEIIKLKQKQPSELGLFSVTVHPELFKKEKFRTNNVLTKTFVLLLAQKHPFSFVTGSPITLREALKDYNRNEFHHLCPRAFLRITSQTEYDESCLANFCFLSKADNNMLGGMAPSAYRDIMPQFFVDEILERAICPKTLFNDNFKTFVDERSELLALEANKLVS